MWKRSMIIAFSNVPRGTKTRFANLENAKKRYRTRGHDCKYDIARHAKLTWLKLIVDF